MTSAELTANGRAFEIDYDEQGDPLFILFPGLRYRLTFPALAMMRELAQQRGAGCWRIATNYDKDARLAQLEQEESVALIAEDSRQIIAALPERPLILVGKSVGCLALIEAVRLRPDAQMIWITPNLFHAPTREAIAASRSFVIYGSEDPVTPREQIASLPCSSHAVLGLDHKLGGANLPASFRQTAQAAVSNWLEA